MKGYAHKMNIAIIFAGGVGSRFKMSEKPKQFQQVDGKEILVHTLEKFQNTSDVDSIILVMVEDWIDYTNRLLDKYQLNKVKHIVPGGKTGQGSIFNGLDCAYQNYPKDSIVLVHDGVRPIIDSTLIKKNIESVKKYGNAITVAPAIETVIALDDNKIKEVYDRSNCWHAKAPQSFVLQDLYSAHLKAQSENKFNFIDSANIMDYYGYDLHIVEGSSSNIKITTNKDYYTLLAYVELEKEKGGLD